MSGMYARQCAAKASWGCRNLNVLACTSHSDGSSRKGQELSWRSSCDPRTRDPSGVLPGGRMAATISGKRALFSAS